MNHSVDVPDIPLFATESGTRKNTQTKKPIKLFSISPVKSQRSHHFPNRPPLYCIHLATFAKYDQEAEWASLPNNYESSLFIMCCWMNIFLYHPHGPIIISFHSQVQMEQIVLHSPSISSNSAKKKCRAKNLYIMVFYSNNVKLHIYMTRAKM